MVVEESELPYCYLILLTTKCVKKNLQKISKPKVEMRARREDYVKMRERTPVE